MYSKRGVSSLVAMIVVIGGALGLLGNLWPASLPPALAPRSVHAQGPIVLDGIAGAGEWDPGWQLITDALDVVITSAGTHPNESPYFAYAGYDVTALWGRYQLLDDNWYFRMDLNGVPGDADSVQGTAAVLGYGGSGDDGGLLTVPASDDFGLGIAEQYSLLFGPDGLLGEVAMLTADPTGPGVLVTLGAPYSTLTGATIYGSTPDPGVLEWRIDKASLFLPGVVQPELWMGATAGVNNDQVSDDAVGSLLVLGIDVANVCPLPEVVVGQSGTFPINYAINPASSYPEASNVVITAPVPVGTTYVAGSCAGGPCSESGGLITWNLGTLPSGTAGVVSFDAVFNVTTGVDTDAYISIAEGLRDETRATGCVGVQPTATATATVPPTPTLPPTATRRPPPPPPPPTETPMPSPTPETAPVFLPESGGSFDNVILLGLASLVCALLLGARVRLHKR